MKRAAVVAAFFLASASTAQAAFTIRVDTFPSQPHAGQTVTVQLRPFWTFADGTRPPALLAANYPWHVKAFSQSGREVSIRVARTRDNPYVWSGTARFRSRGSWTLCVHNVGCGADSPGRLRLKVRAKSARIEVWQRLERPFQFPPLLDGGRCPLTAATGDLSRIGFVGPAWGGGPAYPAIPYAADEPVLLYEDPIPPTNAWYGSKWFGQKVLWVIDSTYSGPVLVRGLQLDGPNQLRFDTGMVVPTPELRIRPFAGPRGKASHTRLRGPGCYAYQVDGLSFSYAIVFEARPV